MRRSTAALVATATALAFAATILPATGATTASEAHAAVATDSGSSHADRCRCGVGDSVGLGVELENRYKGLRAPHKIKFGVSGCTRECAEAQSKDIGVIATENGWNLYVCGNGGMRPRHAELFATDLDDEQLYRTIDRLLMFYVRTADRLQRTSVWRENLEGGLDYLKDVILEDSLGIGAELERQMQHVVDSYQCEWANAIGDPEKLRRFRTFVNDTLQAAYDDGSWAKAWKETAGAVPVDDLVRAAGARATNTINYSGSVQLAQGVDFG